MKRAQLMLSEDIEKEIKKNSKSLGISQSELVRKLLNQALGIDSQTKVKHSIKNKIDVLSVLDLSSYSKNNSRIQGFREIFSVGGKTTEIKILDDNVFRYYLNNKKLPEEFTYQIQKIAEDIKGASLTKTIAVRRGYVVPSLENPPGPRFLGLRTSEVVEAIIKIYKFAIEHEYYKVKGSQICAFFYPFADPKPLELPLKLNSILPYGGYAVPSNNLATRVEVLATWGNNEGVQSFDSIDHYIIDTNRKIIIEKSIPQKNLMLCTTTKSQSQKVAVPQDRQFEQVLGDSEILEIGRVVTELNKKYGLRRVEFSFDGKEGIVFNESAPYQITESKIKNINKHGTVRVVGDQTDLEKISQLNSKEIDKSIVYIDKSIVENRAYDVLNGIAGLSHKFTVLYPGLSATAHAMRILTDFGHTAIVVGNRIFKENEEITIKTINGQIDIDTVSKSNTKNYMLNLYDAQLYGKELVGGKAFNLSTLKSKGFNVPHGFVLTTKFTQNEKTIDKTWLEISKVIPLKMNLKYAVRSSANVEDDISHSFAGQFDSFLNVPVNEILTKAKQVIKSSQKNSITEYLKALNRDIDIKMAVVIQEMIDAQVSGVIFGKNLETGNEDQIIIDVAKGLAEGVVDGTKKSQRIYYLRSKDEIMPKDDRVGNYLNRMQIDSLIEMTRSVENLMGGRQDIEWAIDKKGQIWIIQTRDI